MRKLVLSLIMLFLLSGINYLSSQCPVNAGSDVTYLFGSSAQLNASGANWTYSWSPTTGLSNSNIANPIVSGGASGSVTTYTVTGRSLVGGNLITNGDFTAGNIGFSSEYGYVAQAPTALYPEGKYGVGTNPKSYHPDFSACTDHTSSSGNMMIANGSPTANQRVWYATVSVTPNTDYAFAAYVTAVHATNPPTLQFKIAGTLLGSPTTFSSSTCNWQEFYQIWNSGSNTSVEISITNQNTVAVGNDFAIDDISFTEICVSTDDIIVTCQPPYPAVSTTVVTSILGYSAVSGGTVTSENGATVTERGVCWNTTGNPTVSDPKTSDGTGFGSYTSSITGLTPGVTYYVRAFATNSNGTGYGQQEIFTTPPNPILTTTAVSLIFTKHATSGGEIISEGQSATTARGVCWNTTGTPTTANSKTTNGTGLGTFTSLMTGLTGGTNYFVRAYVINAQGAFYGNEVTFTTAPPTQATNDSYTINEDAPATIMRIQDNDYYTLDGPATTPLKIISNPVHGTIVINNNATPTNPKDDYIVYTPIANHHGTENIIYEICDFYGDCVRATANITILSVDDAPTATDDNFTVKQTTYDNIMFALRYAVFGGDVPFDGPGSFTVITYPTQGEIVVMDNGTPADPTDDYILYTPDDGFIGTDSFVYEICDPDGDCVTNTINIVIERDLFNISKGFSPNGDGINDLFIIGDLTMYPNNSLTIINRWGNRVYEGKPYNNDWDGTNIYSPAFGIWELPQGTYFFLFDPGNRTGVRKGHFYLKRK